MTATFIRDDDKISVVRLVTAAQNGDREAFGLLFERFEGHVFAILTPIRPSTTLPINSAAPASRLSC